LILVVNRKLWWKYSQIHWLNSIGNYGLSLKRCATGSKRVDIFSGHQDCVNSIAVSGKWLYSGSGDNTVKQWEIATGKCVATFDNSLCAGANITGVRGLTEAQISSLQTLGAISDDLGIN
jgi:WD40 repeat protein